MYVYDYMIFTTLHPRKTQVDPRNYFVRKYDAYDNLVIQITCVNDYI